MNTLTFSKRTSNFIDKADVDGNIRNNRLGLGYLNQIDSACKKAGITTGAVYPFLGDEESTRFNLLNPDEFKIDWYGSLIFDNGVEGDGLTGYGDTNIIPANDLELNNTHLSVFTLKEIPSEEAGIEIGALGVGAGTLRLGVKYYDRSYFEVNTENNSGYMNTSSSKGMYLTTKTEPNKTKLFIRSNFIIEQDQPSNILTIYKTFLFRQSFEFAPLYSKNKLGFASIGNGIEELKAKVFSHDIMVALRGKGRW